VDRLNSFEESRYIVRKILSVKRKQERSEFSSKIFTGLQKILLVIFETKISKMSGFLRSDVGQYVGPGGPNTLKLFTTRIVYMIV